MNSQKIKYFALKKKQRSLLFLMGAALVTLGACSDNKDKTDIVAETPSGTFLSVKISGINDGMKIATVAKNNPAKNAGQSVNALAPGETMVSTSEFDALLSMDEVVSAGQGNKRASLAAAANSGQLKAETSLMPTNNQYRILLYDAATNSLISDVKSTAGTDPAIQIDGGKKYNWVAFSINETTVPSVSNGKVAAADLANKDVLYASGTLDAKTGKNYLNIVFEHKTTRFDLDIDTRGLFGSINTLSSVQLGTYSGSQFTSLIRTADLNVATGQFSNSTAVSAASTAKNVSNTSTSTGDLVKTVTLYSVVPAATSVPQGTLSIQPIFATNLDEGIFYPPNGNLVYTRSYGNTSTYLKFANTAFVPEAAGQYHLSARIVESPIKTGNILWARSDLWYDGTASRLDKYRFKADAGVAPRNNSTQSEFWNWMSSTPTGTVGSGDPCALVYPQGVWRVPTESELKTLNGRSSAEYRGLGSQQADTYNYYAVINQYWAVDNNSPASAGNYSGYSNKVILTFNGFRDNGTLQNSRMIIDSRKQNSFNANVTLAYWSSTPNGSNACAINQNASVDYQQPYKYNTTYNSRTVSYYSKNYGFNVRCVRK